MNLNSSTSLDLVFQETAFNVVDIHGKPWLRGTQVAEALGYKNARQSIDALYSRNADEFDDSMVALVKLPDLRHQFDDAGRLHPQSAGAGQSREVRIFSPRGCYLLAMFAQTENAKAFRRWVLDVLEGKTLSIQPTSDTPQAAPNLGFVFSYCFENRIDVRVLLRNDGEVWFVVADVCEAIGLGNPTMAVQRLDAEDVAMRSIEAKGKPLNLVSEAGVFILLAGSRKPEVKPFKEWIGSLVLPAIRKQGFYSAGGALTKDRLALLKMARQLALDIAKSKEAFSRNVLVGLLREIAGALGQPLPALPELDSPKEPQNG
ncbi:MAG: BRO family protein [Proteobacteria bacterium]|nr:BRO family protein [Pseudomonadota bacterium]